MKKHKTFVLLLTVPLALFAQSSSVDTSIDSVYSTKVNISDVSAETKSPDIKTPKIPTVKKGVLPDESEVVLDLPGQSMNSGEASVDDEEAISVDFPDEDVRTILRSVADLYDLNLVIPDSLQGRTSVKLNNITWDQVFEVVLEPLGYTFIEDRNIIRIKSIEELTAEPVDTRIFIINYARAEELKTSIQPLIDPAAGGNIQVDVRSNALVIKERPSRMGKVHEVIKSLDQPTEQVMIESKFIEVSDTDVDNIGINWTSLNEYGVSAGGTGPNGEFQRTWNRARGEDDPNIADNFTSRIDTAVFSADEFSVLISALETKNDIKLVSQPTVVALNNTSAKIAIGERYPLPQYAFNAQTGERQLTGFEYIDIGINLDVVPSVNDAGFINLDVIPEVSAIGELVDIEGTEIPRINSRRTEANITIKDGYTLAIGGLSSEDTNNNSTKVPVLGDIPLLGKLFRSRADTTVTRNLVIFLTAKTLDPDGSTYRDVVDPRTLNKMNVVPSDLPGYVMPTEDLQVLQEMEDLRTESRREDEIESVQAEVDSIKKSKAEEEKKAKKKDSPEEDFEAVYSDNSEENFEEVYSDNPEEGSEEVSSDNSEENADE